MILIVLHSRYDYALSVTVGAALAMLAAFGYARASARWPGWRVVLFAGLCLLLYYVAGAAFYVFALCAMIREFYAPGRWWVKWSLIVWVVVARCTVSGILTAFHPGLMYLHIPSLEPFHEELALSAGAVAFYASFPLTALVLADRNAHRSRADRAPADLRSLGDGGQPPPDSSAGFRWWAVTILLLVATGIAARLACRRDERTVLRLHDSADHQRWDEVLRLATQVAPDWYSQYVTHDVHQALYHTGRLPFDMFLVSAVLGAIRTSHGNGPLHLGPAAGQRLPSVAGTRERRGVPCPRGSDRKTFRRGFSTTGADRDYQGPSGSRSPVPERAPR